MKNIFYFDDSYEMTLLLNEECEDNCIFFIVDTGAAANQYLDIVCNKQNTSQLLESGKRNVIQLSGERWATGGCTTFRLRNDSITTEWYNIDFPETMSTDMCLCETSEYHFAAQCQKSEFDVNEIKSSTLVYTNTRDYFIDSSPKKIIYIQYTVVQEVNATFTVTISLKATGIEDTANITFKIQVNKLYDATFTPTQKITNGEHIITLHYPLIDPVVNNTNTINVFAEVDQGQVIINQEKIKATLTATGLMTDIKWDGTIEIEETYKPITIDSLELKTMTENNATAVKDTPTYKGISQSMNKISLGSLALMNMTDSVTTDINVNNE